MASQRNLNKLKRVYPFVRRTPITSLTGPPSAYPRDPATNASSKSIDANQYRESYPAVIESPDYGPPVVPQYDNPLGSGNRSQLITITSNLAWTVEPTYDGTSYGRLVNGNTTGVTSTTATIWDSQPASGKYITFDFRSAKLVKEAKFYQGPASAWLFHGYMKWQGSNDDVGWTDIGEIFRLGGGLTLQTQTELNGNVVEYRYYRLYGTSGTMSNSPYIQEFEFKIN